MYKVSKEVRPIYTVCLKSTSVRCVSCHTYTRIASF